MNILAAITLAITSAAGAASITTDEVRVSTIGATAAAGGIAFSSYVSVATDRKLTLQGAAGFINTASSVSASAFFGNGSHLTGISNSILYATQTFSGANTFGSSFTVRSQGRAITLSTSSLSNNFSIDGSGILQFYPELHNSSHTLIPQVTTTSQDLGPCVSGSTIAITTSGGRVEVSFTGTLGNSFFKATFLQDGQFVDNQGIDAGITFNVDGAFGTQGGFNYLLPAPAAGQHQYCFTMSKETASDITLFNDSTHANIFYVKELK